MRRVIVLGSTGSIGTQALDVIRANPDRFELVGLAAGSRPICSRARPRPSASTTRRSAPAEAEQLVRDVEADVVLNAITGSIGLGSTLAALKAGRTLALANKESLIVGGALVTALAEPGQIVPVDSEHSALAQALRSGTKQEVRRLVVTASGGPFRGRTRAELSDVTPAEALAHPTWDMGRMVTTNSATLVNKGLEVIEAHLLFGVDYERIEVVVHPQSIVHSMVEFIDGSTIAQASPPDMRLPISLGLDWPQPRQRRRAAAGLDHRDELDVRAARQRGVPVRCAGEEGRPGGRHLSRRLQRGERAGRERVPRRPAAVPRHRRHDRARRRRARAAGRAHGRDPGRRGGVGQDDGGQGDREAVLSAGAVLREPQQPVAGSLKLSRRSLSSSSRSLSLSKGTAVS